ncbi:MAG: hypothetical protein AAF577_04665 [Pseudomonadota bacterium]
MRAFRLALAAFSVAMFSGNGPAEAQATSDGVNPCDFSGADAACQLTDGVYRAWKPKGEGPFPALVYLYGSLGEADRIYRSEEFRLAITGAGYVLIVPEALPVINYIGGITGTGWGHSNRKDEHPRDDVAFLRQVLTHAEQFYRIDRKRVVFAGQSDGGFMIWDLACHYPDMAAGYAVHAGSYGGPLPQRCARPVRFVQAHGRRDTVVPFEAERVREGLGVTSANPVEGLNVLAATAGCAPRDTAEIRNMLDFRQTIWRDCDRGGSIEYWVHRGGHSFPGTFLPLVISWFEQFDTGPAPVGQRAVRRVGEGSFGQRAQQPSATRLRAGQRSGGRFQSVPK